MTIYHAYLDESYSEDTRVFAVGGYLVRADNAELMETEWNAVLARYSVPFFHMVDVAHCTEKACHPLYRHLGPKGADQLAREMIELIKKYITIGFVALVNPKYFDPPEKEPYVFCLEKCVIVFTDWMLAFDRNSKVVLFFEAGNEHSGKAEQTVTRGILGSIAAPMFGKVSFVTKTQAPIVQAADLLVWQAAKFLKDQVSKKRKRRGDFLNLVRERHAFLYAYGDGSLSIRNGEAVNALIDFSPHFQTSEIDKFIECMFAKHVPYRITYTVDLRGIS